MYQALKEAKKLVAYEKKLLERGAADKRNAKWKPPDRSRQRQCSTRRRSPRGIARAEIEDRGHQRIEIADIGAMIDDRRADRELAVDQGGRRRRDPGFLDIDDDIAIDLLASAAR